MNPISSDLYTLKWFLSDHEKVRDMFHLFGAEWELKRRTLTHLLTAYTALQLPEIAHAALTIMRDLRDNNPEAWDYIVSNHPEATNVWDILRSKESEMVHLNHSEVRGNYG